MVYKYTTGSAKFPHTEEYKVVLRVVIQAQQYTLFRYSKNLSKFSN